MSSEDVNPDLAQQSNEIDEVIICFALENAQIQKITTKLDQQHSKIGQHWYFLLKKVMKVGSVVLWTMKNNLKQGIHPGYPANQRHIGFQDGPHLNLFFLISQPQSIVETSVSYHVLRVGESISGTIRYLICQPS